MLTFDIPFRRLFAAAVSIFFCAAGLSKVALAQDGDMDMLRALERKGILILFAISIALILNRISILLLIRMMPAGSWVMMQLLRH